MKFLVPDAQTQALAALVARRRQLIEMLTAEKNRLRLAVRPLQKRLQAHITWLEKGLAATNTDLERTIQDSPVWREKDDLLRSVPGVVPVLATTLFANPPELRTPSRKDDSTAWSPRHSVGDALFAALLAFLRHFPSLFFFCAGALSLR